MAESQSDARGGAGTEPNTALLLFLSYRHAEERILQAITDAGHAITLTQARVAARISPDGTRLTDLAAAAQITKQSAGAHVDVLERAGYVERVPDPIDARARLVRLTPATVRMQAVARETEAAIETEWTAHLGAPAMHQLRSALSRLREITDPWA